MANKRIVDLIATDGIINPLRNIGLFSPYIKQHEVPSASIARAGRYCSKLKKSISRCHVIDYTNVIEVGFWKGQDHMKKLLGTGGISKDRLVELGEDNGRVLRSLKSNYGRIRTPFPEVFIEAKVPNALKDPLGGPWYADRAEYPITRVGALIHYHREQMEFTNGDGVPVESQSLTQLSNPTGHLEFHILKATNRGVLGPVWAIGVNLDANGEIAGGFCNSTTPLFDWLESHKQNGTSLFMDEKLLAALCLDTILYALQMLNCKNVKETEIEPSPKLSKRFRKKTGLPLSRYHILSIGKTYNAKREQKETHTEGSEGHKRAQHIARGHFRTYTPEKPLFGIVHGTFWIDAHVRGDRSEGVVKKDYSIA